MQRKDILEIVIGLAIGFNIVLPVLMGKNSLDYLTEFVNNEKAPIEALGDILKYNTTGENNSNYGSFNFPDGYNPLKYYNDSGTWKPINLIIKPINQDGYSYIVNETWYNYYMKSHSNWGDGFKFKVDDYSFVYQPTDMSYRNQYGSQDYLENIQDKVGVVNNSDYTITYPDVFSNVDLQYKMNPYDVKEYFILNEIPRVPYSWLTGNVTLDFGGYIKYGNALIYVDGVNKTGQNFVTSNCIDFYDSAKKEILYYLPSPTAQDSEGNITECEYEVKYQGSDIYFYLRTPYNWLKNATFPVQVDPTYGMIADAVIDSYEWNTADGWVENPDAFVRLGDSNYFMTSGRGTDYDGFLTTFKVDDNGTFVKSVTSEWEYDTTDGKYAGICNIYGDIYAVYYQDASNSVIFTTRAWSSNGTLQKTMLDSVTPSSISSKASLIHVTGDIYAFSYQTSLGGADYYLETYNITSTGDISARIDVVTFDDTPSGSANGMYTSMALVDSNTVAIVEGDTEYDGKIYTYNISAAGDITNTYTDYWEFDGTRGLYPHIKKIYGNVFAISYQGTDSDGFVKTCTIADTGAITKSFIDTLEFDTVYCTSPTIFTVLDSADYNPGVYGISYQGPDSDGFVKTMNITSAGSIDATVCDSLEFDTAQCYYHAPVIYVANDTYVLAYGGSDGDGWARTISITTVTPPNTAPTITGPSPVNQSTGISLQPRIHVIVSDADSDTMTCNFYTSPDGTTWTWIQSNSTVATGTNISAPYTAASAYSTKYYWKVTADDGTDNTTSDIYEFTTIVPSWKTSSTWNGTLYNQSWWKNFTWWNGTLYNQSWFKPVATWNGTIYNNSWFKTINTWNGTLWNQSWYKTISSWNGSLYNTSIISLTIITTWNGTLYNTSWFKQIATWNGSIYNQSEWKAIATWNGTIYNTSLWKSISAWNGTIFNTTYWYSVATWNGTIYNTSNWLQVSAWNGTIYNTSNWLVTGLWNGTIYNTSIFKTINTWNGTLYNASWFKTISAWNGTIFNLTIFNLISQWNGTIYNLSNWQQTSAWNGTIYNISNYLSISIWNGTICNISNLQSISTWNGTIYNNSWFKTINTWNGTIYNLSYWFNSSVWNGTIYNISNYLVVSNWNGTIYNTTNWISASLWNGTIYNNSWYKTISTWNGTIYNVSLFKLLTKWNGTIYNITSLLVNVTDENPVNESNVSYSNIGLPTCINVTYPAAPTGLNITWWSNASGTWNVYGSEYIFENGTYCAYSTNFSDNTTYYWNISVSSGTVWVNESYWFNTTNVTTGTGITLSYSWVVGPIIMYGGLAIFYWRRCKRRKKEV